MGTTVLSQCWNEQISPLSAPWTFCRTSCLTPGPKYPRTRGHGCAARAGPGLWRFLSVPRQHCNNTHRQIGDTAKGRGPAAAITRENWSEVRQAASSVGFTGTEPLGWAEWMHSHRERAQTPSSTLSCLLFLLPLLPSWDPCHSRGWSQNHRDLLRSRECPETAGLTPAGLSSTALHTAKLSHSILLQLILKGQTSQKSLHSRTSALGAWDRNSYHSAENLHFPQREA